HIFVSPNSQPIRIPKPFELGITFGTFFERMMQHYKEDDPKAFQGFAKQMLDGFTPDIIPTLFVPWIEAFSNKKKFSGAPVVPKREEGLLKKDQYGAYTSETSKLLGKKFDQSPRILDNTITGYTGTLGTYALGGVDKLLKMAGKVNPPPRPDGGLATYPVTKSFVSKGLEGSSQSLDDFYKERGDLTSKQLSAKKNEVDFAETSRLKELDATAKEIKKRQDEIRTILDDPDMKPADKREAIKTLNLQVTNLAREAKGLPAIKG
ncbi:MAG TPA: LPD38 domain-containing protein, partial [Flavisolibacter sp.]|nr:LPD38 domain-containing protein [Flavisolibacter sp.]